MYARVHFQFWFYCKMCLDWPGGQKEIQWVLTKFGLRMVMLGKSGDAVQTWGEGDNFEVSIRGSVDGAGHAAEHFSYVWQNAPNLDSISESDMSTMEAEVGPELFLFQKIDWIGDNISFFFAALWPGQMVSLELCWAHLLAMWFIWASWMHVNICPFQTWLKALCHLTCAFGGGRIVQETHRQGRLGDSVLGKQLPEEIQSTTRCSFIASSCPEGSNAPRCSSQEKSPTFIQVEDSWIMLARRLMTWDFCLVVPFQPFNQTLIVIHYIYIYYTWYRDMLSKSCFKLWDTCKCKDRFGKTVREVQGQQGWHQRWFEGQTGIFMVEVGVGGADWSFRCFFVWNACAARASKVSSAAKVPFTARGYSTDASTRFTTAGDRRWTCLLTAHAFWESAPFWRIELRGNHGCVSATQVRQEDCVFPGWRNACDEGCCVEGVSHVAPSGPRSRPSKMRSQEKNDCFGPDHQDSDIQWCVT